MQEKIGSEVSAFSLRSAANSFSYLILMSAIDLPELYRQTVFEDFNETPELRATHQLSALRESISLLPQLEDQLKDTSDLNLIRFLRSKKFDHQRHAHNGKNLTLSFIYGV